MVDLLLQFNLIGPWELNPNSRRRPWIHNISQILRVMALNLASALDLATTGCFLVLELSDQWHEAHHDRGISRFTFNGIFR